jgi:hypothetical protein
VTRLERLAARRRGALDRLQQPTLPKKPGTRAGIKSVKLYEQELERYPMLLERYRHEEQVLLQRIAEQAPSAKQLRRRK